jgi:hypothetical protein
VTPIEIIIALGVAAAGAATAAAAAALPEPRRIPVRTDDGPKADPR